MLGSHVSTVNMKKITLPPTLTIVAVSDTL